MAPIEWWPVGSNRAPDFAFQVLKASGIPETTGKGIIDVHNPNAPR